VAERAGHDCPADQAVALETANQLREALRRLWAEQPASDGDRGEIRLIARALGELGGAAGETPGIACGVDERLWVEVDDGTLLLRSAPFCFSWNFDFSGRFARSVASGRLSTAGGREEHAYRETTQNIRRQPLRVCARREFAAVTAAMTGAAADPTRRRRPHRSC
jgi:hypothetical protein